MSPERALCVDTDALVNLLALNCLEPALDGLGFSLSDCFRLRSAKKQIEKSSWVENHWPLFDRAGSIRLVEQMRLLPKTPALELLSVLNLDGIDEGEAYFLATLVENPHCLLLTGNKRMLEALHRPGVSEEVIRIREVVRGRVMVFPQIVAELVQKLSLSVLEERVRSAFCRHRTLKILFGSKKPTRPADFWSAYESEMRHLEEICGQDWLFPLEPRPPRPARRPGDHGSSLEG